MKSMEKVMQKWKSYGKHFQQNRLYMGILLLNVFVHFAAHSNMRLRL